MECMSKARTLAWCVVLWGWILFQITRVLYYVVSYVLFAVCSSWNIYKILVRKNNANKRTEQNKMMVLIGLPTRGSGEIGIKCRVMSVPTVWFSLTQPIKRCQRLSKDVIKPFVYIFYDLRNSFSTESKSIYLFSPLPRSFPRYIVLANDNEQLFIIRI